jgi:hypothetical protein
MKKKFFVFTCKDGGRITWFAIFGLLAFFALLSSCNNDTDTQSASANQTDSANLPTEEGAVAPPHFDGKYPILTISRADIDRFFTPANVQKLVFRFHIANNSALPTLIAFQATSVTSYEPTPLAPVLGPLAGTENTPLVFPVEMGNLELSRRKYEALPGSTNGVTLLFIPRKKGNNVTYSLHWLTTSALSITSATADSVKTATASSVNDDNTLNPSPPDPPSFE